MNTSLKLAAFVLLFITYAVRSSAQQQVQIQSLSLEQATAFALRYHPSIRSAEAAQQAAAAGLTQAEAAYYPQITASAVATRTDGAFVFNPDTPVRNQTYNNYTTGIAASQNIFDFGRTINRVSANSSFTDAASNDVRTTRETIAMNVQIAYFTELQTVNVVQVDEEAVRGAEQHLKQAQAFYTVGRRAQFDVTKAQVDLANANVALITARNQVSLARLQLEDAMGIHPASKYAMTDSLTMEPFTVPLDTVKSIAVSNRPDLLSAMQRVQGNNSLVSAAWEQNLPALSASGTYNWSGFDFPLFSRFNGGLTLSLPIFQGFAISAQTDQARAAEAQAQANLDLLNQSLRTEVEQNYLSLKEAEERVGATEKLVQQAVDNLNLAERQYAAGVSSVIDVTDARLTLSNARITRIQAFFDYNSSLVRLRRSMGVLAK